ncbi:MAG: aminopeptidase P family protein [Clostridia bacterium]|nr:aminopeptidase P family protein [Clostridia bacterium]
MLNDVFTVRLEKLREIIRQSGINGLHVTKEANVRYLTGKAGDDCTLWITDCDAFILTDFRYKEMALELMPLYIFQEIKSDSDICDFLNRQGKMYIGVEKDSLKLSQYLSFKENLINHEIILTEGLIEEFRAIKDCSEIESIQKACNIADACFHHMCSFLRPGISEQAAALEIEYYMKSNGAEDLSFKTICVSGPKTSYPHGIPGDKKIEKGEFVTMDFGCKVDGYCSDMTRTVAIGSTSEEMRDVYNLVLKAQIAACQNIKAGMSCKDADNIAREIIQSEGYGAYFGHGLGHGTGLEIHEAPRLSPTYSGILKENNIISIEPGIYLPQKFGVRIEDLATVTAFGIINNVNSPKELIIL